MIERTLGKHVYMRDCSAGATISTAPQTWHWENLKHLGISACGRALLITDDEYNPCEAPKDRRCMASGCRQKWKLSTPSSVGGGGR